jgi:hypothetical protein
MSALPKLPLALKAAAELGLRQVARFALYQLGLKTGYFRWRTPSPPPTPPPQTLSPALTLPDPDEVMGILGEDGYSKLIEEANEIVNGQVRLFGVAPVPLQLSPLGTDRHWTAFKSGTLESGGQGEPVDIKFTWEPARFGWAFTLGRAYHLSGDEVYPEAFWRYFTIFQESNPPYQGPNWASAQEAAFRIIAFVFASQVFSSSAHSTQDRMSTLAQAVSQHAARIPPTLVYARAQNNNHLLSEAAGLVTAAACLPDHPESKRWDDLGWKWFNRGLETQIGEDGAYMQHSTNYQRLVLQLGLWVLGLQGQGDRLSSKARRKLMAATSWLLALCDPASGSLPNLGPNDGAYLLPLTILPHTDYRPVLQATAANLLGEPPIQPGIWDEMNIWLLARPKTDVPSRVEINTPAPSAILRSRDAWGYLRAARFTGRPGHADQLHLDLWWRGLNLAQDTGTYLYNAALPWDNALTHTAVHNTLMVDNLEQMTRAGRFLYLDWAQAEVSPRERAEDGSWERITAWHNGYRHLGLVHQRSLTAYKDGHWVVNDQVSSVNSAEGIVHTFRLHWLLPDWSYELLNSGTGLRLRSPHGWVTLEVAATGGLGQGELQTSIQIHRAGEILHGEGEANPVLGWVSLTYGQKIPAISLGATVSAAAPLQFVSRWSFPDASSN